ncbi:MAG: hypothetical protein ABIS03_08780, partial [Gemmatimonadaceae bacterium]
MSGSASATPVGFSNVGPNDKCKDFSRGCERKSAFFRHNALEQCSIVETAPGCTGDIDWGGIRYRLNIDSIDDDRAEISTTIHWGKDFLELACVTGICDEEVNRHRGEEPRDLGVDVSSLGDGYPWALHACGELLYLAGMELRRDDNVGRFEVVTRLALGQKFIDVGTNGFDTVVALH